MFHDIIMALREAVGAFDVSDTPEEPVSRPSIKKPPAPPLKALRGYKPPIKRAKLPGMRIETIRDESSKFGPVINEMRSLLEKMGKMAKSGVPKVDRQDAMARHVGVKINLPTDLTGARKIMRMRQKPDPMPTPEPLPRSTRKKMAHLTNLVKQATR